MISVFNIPIDVLTKEQFGEELKKGISEKKKISIATVNPEILLAARKNADFSSTLLECTLRVVDGFGLSLVIWLKYKKWVHRLIGRDVVDGVFALAKKEKLIVGVIGGREDVSERATSSFQKKYPEASVVDLTSGEDIVVSELGRVIKNTEIVERNLERLKPNIVLVGFGAPKQERFMLSLLKQHDSVRIACGIGGILDVEGNKLRPAPSYFSRLGLEWLWRVMQEPKRFTRILRAVIVFPVRALFLDKIDYEK